MRIIGILLIVIGGIVMAGSFGTDITASTGDGYRVANLGLAAGRQAGITVGGFLFVGGWIALGAAAVRAAILKAPAV